MIIRTPRRRISPRTKRKYKAIKSLLRKFLGTSSEGNIYTNSSIEVSVSDIKTKIDGIEQQLNIVSKHCRDISCLERKVRRQTANLSVCSNHDVKSIGENFKSDRNLKNVETKVLYKKSDRQCHRNDESESAIDDQSHDKENMTSRPFDQNVYNFESKLKRKHNENELCELRRHQRKTKSKHETIPVYSTSSFHSLVEPKHKQYAEPGCSGYHQREGFGREDTPNLYRNRKIVEQDCWNKNKKYEVKRKEKRNKLESSKLDQDFIEKIIKKQYKPVKVFGRRDSDFSQFSAPVCRDHEFAIKENIQEGSELCSCCFDGRKHRHRYIRNNDLSDMRSVCDTRLYSSKKHHRHIYSNRHVDDYNNSAYYDVVPVKEKSSPLSRRKFIEDNVMTYQYCKEVPPSPRTRRPRLNLKAQNYAEYGDSLIHKKHRRRVSPIGYHNYQTGLASDLSFHQKSHENLAKIKIPECTQQENIGTMNSLQSPNLNDEQLNQTNDTLNTEITNVTVDKTEKALGEIKDILQSFLIEIKKESIHSDKSNITSKLGGKSFIESQENNKMNTTIIPNSGHNFGTHTGQCNMTPFLPSFPNPCCYPIIPVCPINCLQNGYIIPSSSFTCSDCAKNSKENTNAEKEKSNKSEMNDKLNTCNETQELIKEIYKYVSQNPKTPRNVDNNENNTNNNSKNDNPRLDKIILTNRSVGGTEERRKRDANVGTPYLRRYSKSCEAIGSRMNSDTYYSTNASYSDTILEKLSLQASQSSTDSDVSSDVSRKKVHQNKFQKLLHSLRLFKRKKKDVIEEVTESESSIADNAKHKAKPPFKQHITNYAMHGQEYFRPPPIPGTFCPPHPKDHCSFGRGFPHQPLPPEMYNHYKHPINQFGMPYDYRMPPKCNPIVHPPCPNYDPYNQNPPQVPLCLKEIEVKSIGTQSQRKMSIFSKFTKKMQPLQQDASQQQAASPPNQPTFWKSFQEKAKQQNPDPIDFSLKTQKQLAQGDMKLRNAMLKKLFYKRNPFSPRNLIVRTLLGKDKSSYGNPPKMYRPRMFL